MLSTNATAAHATQTKAMPNVHQIGVGTSMVTMTFGVAFTTYKLRFFDTTRND